MKKLILLLLLLFTTLTFSQQISNLFLRAESLQVGYKNDKGSIVWANNSDNTNNTLIKITDNEVSIYSKIPQVYHILKFVSNDNSMLRWSCVDNRGKLCELYVMEMTKTPGKLGVAVEFDDYIWIYICKLKGN